MAEPEILDGSSDIESEDTEPKRRELEEGLAATVELQPTPNDTTPSGDSGPIEWQERKDTHVGRIIKERYRLEKRIGEGGMGMVYAAEHIHLRKRFAIKLLSERVLENKEAVQRLKQEAILASGIDHDNIVNVFDLDATDRDEVFIAMELLRGQSLAALLDGGAVPVDRAIAITLQICDALQAAHEHGIVHRDLKPENLFLVPKGKRELVKVLDFGISKVKTAESEQVRVTRTGQLVGTPLYMSPEQARGEIDVDHRADIYAIGVILYEMLTGVVPFEGANYFQLLWKHGNEPPAPPTARKPDLVVPAGVEAAVLKALEKVPSDRFESAAAFGDVLREAIEGRPSWERSSVDPGTDRSRDTRITPSGETAMPGERTPHTTPAATPRPSSSRGKLAVAVAVVAVAAAIAFVAFRERGEPPVQQVIAPPIVAPPPVVAEPETPETPEPQTAPEPAAPHLVRIAFDSTPRGASIEIAGEAMPTGTTPTVLEVPFGDTPIEVRLTKPGYEDLVEQMTPETMRVSGRLVRRPAPATSTKIRPNDWEH